MWGCVKNHDKRNEKLGDFNLEFEGDDFRIATKDKEGNTFYVTSKPDKYLPHKPNRKNGAQRLVLTEGIFFILKYQKFWFLYSLE